MTDQELVELAAKAAGMSPASFDGHNVGWYDPQRGTTGAWNPLADDGDALRLMVALRLDVEFDGQSCVRVNYVDTQGRLCAVESHVIATPYADVRRAIALAAAEIEMGKSLTC